jgi:hypothetical protein
MRIVSVGDMGYGETSDDTVATLTQLVEAGKVDFVLHDGDISYADGAQAHWDVFFRKIEPLAARVPWMVTPGNHEVCDSLRRDLSIFVRRCTHGAV